MELSQSGISSKISSLEWSRSCIKIYKLWITTFWYPTLKVRVMATLIDFEKLKQWTLTFVVRLYVKMKNIKFEKI